MSSPSKIAGGTAAAGGVPRTPPPTQPAEEATRYTRHSILRSEQMYGTGFQSPGQLEAMRRFCAMLDLHPGMRVLEIGSGLGGAAFYLARQHGVEVTGLDTAPAMIELSRERSLEQGLDGVQFLLGDVRAVPLTGQSFDLVWSRDTILYVPDKVSVWRRVRELLRPGGQLFVTDFCRGAGEVSAEFAAYTRDAGYFLQDIPSYAETLRACGYEDVNAIDNTPAFQRSLSEELAQLEVRRGRFLESFTPEDYVYLDRRWHHKRAFCERGDLTWGLFLARKPR